MVVDTKTKTSVPRPPPAAGHHDQQTRVSPPSRDGCRFRRLTRPGCRSGQRERTEPHAEPGECVHQRYPAEIATGAYRLKNPARATRQPGTSENPEPCLSEAIRRAFERSTTTCSWAPRKRVGDAGGQSDGIDTTVTARPTKPTRRCGTAAGRRKQQPSYEDTTGDAAATGAALLMHNTFND